MLLKLTAKHDKYNEFKSCSHKCKNISMVLKALCLVGYKVLKYGGTITQICVLQKKTIRIVTKSDYYAPTNPLFIDLKTLKLQELEHGIWIDLNKNYYYY